MSKIKSALEKALERASEIHVDPAKLLEIEHVPQGKALAGRFLYNQDIDLEAEIRKVAPETRKYVLEGVQGSLANAINLPVDQTASEANQRAFEGLLTVKEDRSAVKQVISELDVLVQYYEQASKQAYHDLKQNFTRSFEQALQNKGQAGAKVRVNVEQRPEFQAEWRKMLAQLTAQYEGFLEEKRRAIREMPARRDWS